MLLKKRKKPRILEKYEVLNYRLRRNFPRLQEVQRAYAKAKRGFEGEQMVDYYLESLSGDCTMLQDVCLRLQGKAFQMDNLVLTPKAIFPVEVKNYRGKIVFDTALQQFTREDGETETDFDHPISQVEAQRSKLQEWLKERGIMGVPIVFLIAISEPSTIIKVNGNTEEISQVVAHAANLPMKIREREKAVKAGPIIPHRKIGYAIRKECIEFDKDIMTMHRVTAEDLVPGVRCPSCGLLGMERVHSGWRCRKCQAKDRTAHLAALEEYCLLIKPRITNSQCMRWLNVRSRSTVTRLLRSSGLIFKPHLKRWVKRG